MEPDVLSPFLQDASGPDAAGASFAISQIEKQIGAGNLAALIIEPIQGEAALSSPRKVSWVRSWPGPRANEVVFIANQVKPALRARGRMSACQHEVGPPT